MEPSPDGRVPRLVPTLAVFVIACAAAHGRSVALAPAPAPAAAVSTAPEPVPTPAPVAAARAGQLTIASVDAKGHLDVVARVPTRAGTRNGVVAADGTVYLAHGGGVALSELVVVSPGRK